jgi:hypothetical protein
MALDRKGREKLLFRGEPILLVRTVPASSRLIDFIGALSDHGVGLVHSVEYVGCDDQDGS